MSNKTHQDMRVASKNSIFLGSITDEDELFDYLTDEFETDFGFEIYEPDAPEAGATQPMPVADALQDFSSLGNDDWKAEVVKMAHNKGIDTTASAVVFYNFAYDPALINPKRSKKIEFLGTVDTK